jgi:hypothetical protein
VLAGYLRVRLCNAKATMMLSDGPVGCSRMSWCRGLCPYDGWFRREGNTPDQWTYNMLLMAGTGSIRQLDKVGKLWAEMRVAGERPTVVSYGTFSLA